MKKTYSMIIALVILNSLLVACGSMMLKPIDPKHTKKEWVIKTNQPKSVAFAKSLSFLSKYINDSNSAIKMRDQKLGRIIAKVSIPCKNFKRPDLAIGVPESTTLNYNIDLAFKKNKAKIEIEALGFYKHISGHGAQNMFIANDKGQDKILNKCMESIMQTFSNELKSKSKNW